MRLHIPSDHGVVHESVANGEGLKNRARVGVGGGGEHGGIEKVANGKWVLGIGGLEEVGMDLLEVVESFAFL